MKRGNLVTGLIALLGAGAAMASSPDNPYRIIAEKNAFRLDPPPVPVVVEPPKVEEKTNLRFTGLAWDGPAVSAWLVIDSLEPGGTSTYLSLAPGEKASGVEIVGIDEATHKVKVKYRDKSLDLAMETTGAAAGPGGRMIPGIPNAPRPMQPTAAIPGLNRSPVANPPGGRGGTFNGGLPAIPTPPINSASRAIPTRTIRGGAAGVANPASPLANPGQNQNQTPAGSRPMSLEESTIAVEVQRAIQPADFPPLPPTGL
jgi:hypothetical protein